MPVNTIDASPPAAAIAPAGGTASASRAPETPEPAPRKAPPSEQEVTQAVAHANRALASMAASLRFALDPDTRIMVVRVVDVESNEVLRQVPSEEMLAIARAIDRAQGLLLHTEV